MKPTILSAALLAALAATPTLADNTAENDDGRVQLGYLTCEMTDGSNLILVSEQTFACVFDAAEDGKDETYDLTITKYGVDLSATESQELRWAVLAPSTFDKHGVLEGRYAGASADIALGYSIGAKALVGGGTDSIALQPVSLTKGEGLGAAVGVERATLTYTGLAE